MVYGGSMTEKKQVRFFDTQWFWKLAIPAIMTIVGGLGVTYAPGIIAGKSKPVPPTITTEQLSVRLDSTNAILMRVKATQDSSIMAHKIFEQMLTKVRDQQNSPVYYSRSKTSP